MRLLTITVVLIKGHVPGLIKYLAMDFLTMVIGIDIFYFSVFIVGVPYTFPAAVARLPFSLQFAAFIVFSSRSVQPA